MLFRCQTPPLRQASGGAFDKRNARRSYLAADNYEAAARLLEEKTLEQIAAVLSELPHDRLVGVCSEIDSGLLADVLVLLGKETQRIILDGLRVLWKEARVSVLLGASLAVACFGKLMVVDNLIFGYKDYTVFTCAVVSLALMFTVVIAKVVGCMLPMLAKKVRLDPAVVASPFITTIVDALSLILYCGLAIAMLG